MKKKDFATVLDRIRVFQNGISVFFLLLFLNLLTGCGNFYKVTSIEFSKDVLEENNTNYIILHHDTIAWHLENITFNDEQQSLSGRIEPVSELHQHYRIKTGEPKKYKRVEGEPFKETHIYTKGLMIDQDSLVTFNMETINKIDVYVHDKSATNQTTVLAVIGGLFIALLVIGSQYASPFGP